MAVDSATYITQALFLAVAIYVALQSLKSRRRSDYYVLTFFALLAVVVAYVWVIQIAQIVPGPLGSHLTVMGVMALPYVLIRLANEYTSVAARHIRISEAGVIIAFALIFYPGTENVLALLFMTLYFAAGSIYAAYRFYKGSEDANGVTRTRLKCLSAASVLIGAALFSVGLSAFFGGILDSAVTVIRQGMLSASAILYLAGFAPPTLLRRTWQEPELRQFLHNTLRLPRWSSLEDTLRYIERATAETLGAPNATIGLWNPESKLIEFSRHSFRPGETIGGQAFEKRRPILSLDTIRDDPESEEIYRKGEAFAVMAAPIWSDEGVIGVVALHSPNPPIFADDDLSLLTIVADQIGVLLENRRHLHAQADLTAREETTRLKDEFLSIAAHDLKTPLTTILATGQYLQRKLKTLGEDSAEFRSIVRLNRESKRLQTLVQQLLDTSRIEHGQLVAHFEQTDIGDLVQEVVDRVSASGSHTITTSVEPELNINGDPVRILQVVENLIENALKYSEPGTQIGVDVWAENDNVRLAVRDNGPGISPEHHANLFDRYFRSPQANNGSAAGIGLGLYICKEIVDQHGGRIWVESTLGEGSTFHVEFERSPAVTSVS